MPTLLARGHALAPPRRQAEILAAAGVPDFDAVLREHGIPALTTGSIEVLQVNVGRVCNQLCAHCHVDAGPDRRESMDGATAALVIEALRRFDIPTLDITGGAMCRTHLSVSSDGRLFDCDFNQMLELAPAESSALTLCGLLASGDLRRRIRTGRHCFGCTAGAGSSCGASGG